MRTFIIVALLFCFFNARADSTDIIIAFRNDDISANSDIIFEYDILQTFHKYGIKPLYAVIPAIGGKVLQPGMPIADSLKSWHTKGWIDIAMHGYTHESNFVKFDFDIQNQKISLGRQVFNDVLGLEVQFFCPPWNAVDKNTLEALMKNDILGFSGYLGEKPVKGMNFINCNSNLFNGPLGNFSEVLDIALSSEKENLLIPLLHTNYDFKGISLVHLDSLLLELTAKDKRIKIVSFTEFMKDKQYTGLLNKANVAGYRLKILQYNKYLRKIVLKTPLINNYVSRRIHLAQNCYKLGNYKEVNQIYIHLLIVIIVSFTLLLLCVTFLALLFKKLIGSKNPIFLRLRKE